MKTISVICNHCNKSFDKSLKEYNRQLKKNPDYKFYCNRTCTGKAVNVNNLIPCGYKLTGGSVRDQYSQFKEHLRRVKRRNKPYDIDLAYLKKV